MGLNTLALECIAMICVLEGRIETLGIFSSWTNTFKVLDGDGGLLTATNWGVSVALIHFQGKIEKIHRYLKLLRNHCTQTEIQAKNHLNPKTS